MSLERGKEGKRKDGSPAREVMLSDLGIDARTTAEGEEGGYAAFLKTAKKRGRTRLKTQLIANADSSEQKGERDKGARMLSFRKRGAIFASVRR